MSAPSNAIQVIQGDIYALESVFNSVLVDKGLSFEREAAFAVQHLMNNTYALSVAQSNRQSVVNAVTNVAAIGISLNPAKKQAYLVPRKVNQQAAICLDISYMGLMDLAVQEGGITWAQAAVVRQNDSFTMHGYDAAPSHNYNPFGTERGAIVGVYVVAKTRGGDYLTHTMPIAAVHAIRDRSEAWKAYVAQKISTCPWVSDEEEMVKKTCVKQASKYWPDKSERLENAIQYLNTDGGEAIELSGQAPNVHTTAREHWIKQAKAATTADELRSVNRSAVREHFKSARDTEGFTLFVQAVQARGAELKAQPSTTPPQADPPEVDDEFVAAMNRAEGTQHA